MKLKITTILILIIGQFQGQTDSLKKATPKDTSWKTTGFLGLNASQTALSNWQGGGQDNVAINAILNAQAEYRKGKNYWLNKIDMQYGLIKPGEAKIFKKNIDQIFAVTKYNLNAFNKYWFYAAQADFRSQMAPGYNYIGDSIAGRATSDFCSPGYIQLAVGLISNQQNISLQLLLLWPVKSPL